MPDKSPQLIRQLHVLESAWPILITAIGLLYWFGSTTATLNNKIDRHDDQMAEFARRMDALSATDRTNEASITNAANERYKQLDDLRTMIARNSQWLKDLDASDKELRRRIEALENRK